MAVHSFDELNKLQNEVLKDDMEKEIADNQELYDNQKKITEEKYNQEIDKTSDAYEQYYRENEVQRIIDERNIAENMANLGLSNSGLNRTQQTAVQLSSSNNKANIDKGRQQALDDLAQGLAQAISTIEQNRLASDSEIRRHYKNQAAQNAIAIQTAEREEETKRLQAQADVEIAQIEANNKNALKATNILNAQNSTLGNLQGSLSSNNITKIHNADGSTTYTDTITGISVTMDVGINPYTGANNLTESTATAKAAQNFGTFSNGYQPKGIINYGSVTDTGKKAVVDGKKQTVWKTKDGTTWIWRGVNNRYERYSDYAGFADWDAGMWEGYFAKIRKDPKGGQSAAEEELDYLVDNGLIPDNMTVYASLGARGGFGH